MKKFIIITIIAGLLNGVASAKELTTSEKDAAITGGVVGGTVGIGYLIYRSYYKNYYSVSLFIDDLQGRIPEINPAIYTTRLGSGLNGTAWLNPDDNTVIKEFFDKSNFDDLSQAAIQPKRVVKYWNDTMDALNHKEFATAQVVKGIDGKIYMKTPYLKGNKVSFKGNASKLFDLKSELLNHDIAIQDLFAPGNTVDINGEIIPVDFDRAYKYSRSPSYFSKGMIKLDKEKGFNLAKQLEKSTRYQLLTSQIKNLEDNKSVIENEAQNKANQIKSQLLVEKQDNASSGGELEKPMSNSKNALLTNEQISKTVNSAVPAEIKKTLYENDEDKPIDKSELSDDEDRVLEDNIKDFKPIE